MQKGRKSGLYAIFDRLFYLMNETKVVLKQYLQKWECSRSTFFRDIEHLKLFYDISFIYNAQLRCYVRKC